jgi:hypothetical protein
MSFMLAHAAICGLLLLRSLHSSSVCGYRLLIFVRTAFATAGISGEYLAIRNSSCSSGVDPFPIADPCRPQSSIKNTVSSSRCVHALIWLKHLARQFAELLHNGRIICLRNNHSDLRRRQSVPDCASDHFGVPQPCGGFGQEGYSHA